jgi:hypothetical protein
MLNLGISFKNGSRISPEIQPPNVICMALSAIKRLLKNEDSFEEKNTIYECICRRQNRFSGNRLFGVNKTQYTITNTQNTNT